jgi:ABC-type molybdate transport system substrate-binding protein
MMGKNNKANYFSKLKCSIAFFFYLIFFTTSFSQDIKERFLTIFAEHEVAPSLIEIIKKYSQKNNINISINFDNSVDLIKDIEAGDPAGIFISSHPQWTKQLKNKGLIDYQNFLDLPDKKLLLVTSSSNNKFNYAEVAEKKNIYQMLSFINQRKLTIIYDNPKTSIGLYFREILKKSKLNKSRVYQKMGEDSKSILTILTKNTEYFSIICNDLLEDSMQVVKKISILSMKRKILIIAGNEMEEAKKFINYLKNNKINF